MAFDGLSIANIISELKDNLIGGKVDKIYQPEKDECILQIRNKGLSYKLLLTANASNPRIHFTNIQKQNPLTAPLFCMVLRKYLANGKIIDIIQPNFERIVNIQIESINELGDYSIKTLVFEIMGKHSNIILLNEHNIILESIKHISKDKSSIREVLPTREYCLPPNQNKKNPLNTTKQEFLTIFENIDLQKAIYKNYTGISPILATEICNLASLDPGLSAMSLNDADINILFEKFEYVFNFVKQNNFAPQLILDKNDNIFEFTSFEFSIFKDYKKQFFNNFSELLEFFYKNRDLKYRLNQKTQDLKKIVMQNIERCIKKKTLQQKILKDIEDRNTLKLYGELITANIYAIKKGMDKIKLNNFYAENFEEIEIKLDTNLTPAENAQKYFKKYNKAKRTFEATQIQIKQNEDKLKYLESVLNFIENCKEEQDIKEIRQELYTEGFLKKQTSKNNKKNEQKSTPMHYISSDGFHIYVGKNNTQNDYLTLKFAKANDIWLHTKEIPGSHVIIVLEGKQLTNTALNEAANLAAYYSKAKNSSLVPVDYTPKKFVKKPNGAKAGMVIYEKNKTAYITPNEDLIKNMQIV